MRQQVAIRFHIHRPMRKKHLRETIDEIDGRSPFRPQSNNVTRDDAGIPDNTQAGTPPLPIVLSVPVCVYGCGMM